MRSSLFKRIRIASLMAVLALSLAPAFCLTAYAGGSYDIDGVISGVNDDGTVTVGAKVSASTALLNEVYGDFSTRYANGEVGAAWVVGGTSTEAVFSGGVAQYTISSSDVGKTFRFETYTKVGDTDYNNMTSEYTIVGDYIDMTLNSDGTATVTGYSTSSTFERLYIDYSNPNSDWTSVAYLGSPSSNKLSYTFDTKNYSIGWHTLDASLKDGTILTYEYYFPVLIYDVPAIKASCVETFKNYLEFTAPQHDGIKYDYYVEVSKKGSGTWTMYGPISPNSSGKITGLKAGTNYQIKALFLPANTTSDTYDWHFQKYSNKTITVKTGPKAKPAIKSVKISKAAVKSVWVKGTWSHGKWYPGYYVDETTYKVTVKFKKKPGVAGIQVYAGGVTLPTYIKGNKKTYSTKFTVSGNAIGKKTSFKIRTKGNKTYGAWSPYITKKAKIKK